MRRNSLTVWSIVLRSRTPLGGRTQPLAAVMGPCDARWYVLREALSMGNSARTQRGHRAVLSVRGSSDSSKTPVHLEESE
jgi:hypothetical protein